jgi:exodeoxyribonuclease VII large subunit
MRKENEVLNDTSPRRVLSVGELNHEIQAALQDAFPASVWVKGEVQRLPLDAARRKHVYFELHDASGSVAARYQIPAALLEWDRERFGLMKYLDGTDPDFQLHNKLEVCLECRVDFYPPFGKLSLRVIGVDKSFTLGQLEARRRQVLEFLRRQGMLEKNSQVAWPLLPLRVGLITAAGSAAEKDFLTGLDCSPYGFQVWRIDCRMQGENTESQVVAALRQLVARKVDVVVITRGGGSRGDLSWFDQKGIAVAIAVAPLPVVTAIGHEIDRSIADAVANHSCKTPTAAAELLVARVDAAAERAAAAAASLSAFAAAALEMARERLAAGSGLAAPSLRLLQENGHRLRDVVQRLDRRVQQRVAMAREIAIAQRSRLVAAATRRLDLAAVDHRHRTLRLGKEAVRSDEAAGERLSRLGPRLAPAKLLVSWPGWSRRLQALGDRLRRLSSAGVGAGRRRLDDREVRLRLLDPQRLLARGYTLTLTSGGELIKSVTAVKVGEPIQTRLHDGRIESIVRTKTQTGAGGESQSGRKGEQRDSTETRSRQDTLFR